MITIRAIPSRGIRRAGVFHPAENVEHRDDHFSEEEVGQLLTESQIIVQVSPDSKWAKLADIGRRVLSGIVAPPATNPPAKDPPAAAAKT